MMFGHCDETIFYYTAQCVGYRMTNEDPVTAFVVLVLLLVILLAAQAWLAKR
jgi:hypothetical protein